MGSDISEDQHILVGEAGPELQTANSSGSSGGGNIQYTMTGSNPPGEWCGQSQPHPPHTWAKGSVGWYMSCSGHS